MVNYSQSSIYKLSCKDPEIKDIYIGSTTNFARRKQEHKKCCNNSNAKGYNYHVYKFIRETGGGFDNWEMVELERFNAVDKRNLHTRERYYLELLGATLNKVVPTRELKEYYQDNKQKIKQYYEDNKEVIIEKHKQWREDNKDIIKEKGKNRYNENKDFFLQKNKQYYKDNKDNLNEKQKKKFTCESCGSEISMGSKFLHDKSKKHLNSLNL